MQLVENTDLPKDNKAALQSVVKSVCRDVTSHFWHQTSMRTVSNILEVRTSNNSKELCTCDGRGTP